MLARTLSLVLVAASAVMAQGLPLGPGDAQFRYKVYQRTASQHCTFEDLSSGTTGEAEDSHLMPATSPAPVPEPKPEPMVAPSSMEASIPSVYASFHCGTTHELHRYWKFGFPPKLRAYQVEELMRCQDCLEEALNSSANPMVW